ncbi:hypothetical protein [Streptomyces sp. MJP52]|uniref:hypothetical protein n=1 Tax=Streptomyces sp. MJP52 TaxID=2940555 RepID=UPI0024758D08|nr:hypothetical protein [Streptomyces sp. MJP52]MDH6224004.1 hypothetical protein [Streptomyces sp. MJP52]
MIQPGQIPQFTGDLTQLETDYAALKTDAGNVRSVGTKVHNQFQGLSAYYQAPEAEKLFATTQVVKDKADTFADGLETVSSALSSYASEIRPLVERLKQLKTEATEFVASVKDDDEWEYDGDKVEEHNRIRDDITATVAAFWAAERTCHNKITALWGGTQMVAGDGSERKDQYGFDAGDMKNAKLPWGDPVEEKHHWYEVGHWVKSFVWDGLIVDGVWGTIKGLGTLVGFGGWEAMKQAWTGLAQLATGLVISAVPVAGALFWTLPDDRLPSWIRDSRTAMKETGKALVAWDEWGKNPARAAGAVTFNVLTTVFTGGAGGAVAGAGKAGAVAKVLGTAGRAIDPMTYIAKGAGAGLSKIGDIATALKGVGTIDIPPLPANAFELPPGTVRLPDGTFDLPAGTTLPDGATRLPDGNVRLPEQTVPVPEGSIKLPTEDGAPARYLDPQGNLLDDTGTVVQRADQAPREPGGTDHGTPADADTPHTPTPSPGTRPGRRRRHGQRGPRRRRRPRPDRPPRQRPRRHPRRRRPHRRQHHPTRPRRHGGAADTRRSGGSADTGLGRRNPGRERRGQPADRPCRRSPSRGQPRPDIGHPPEHRSRPARYGWHRRPPRPSRSRGADRRSGRHRPGRRRRIRHRRRRHGPGRGRKPEWAFRS